jgi:hypothetical protein
MSVRYLLLLLIVLYIAFALFVPAEERFELPAGSLTRPSEQFASFEDLDAFAELRDDLREDAHAVADARVGAGRRGLGPLGDQVGKGTHMVPC